jgi:hypothetical protein
MKTNDKLVVISSKLHNRKFGDIVTIIKIYIADDFKGSEMECYDLDNGYTLYSSDYGLWNVNKHCIELKEYRKRKLLKLNSL